MLIAIRTRSLTTPSLAGHWLTALAAVHFRVVSKVIGDGRESRVSAGSPQKHPETVRIGTTSGSPVIPAGSHITRGSSYSGWWPRQTGGWRLELGSKSFVAGPTQGF